MTFLSTPHLSWGIYPTPPFLIVTCGSGEGGGMMMINIASIKCLLCVRTCITFFIYSLCFNSDNKLRVKHGSYFTNKENETHLGEVT